MFKQLFRIVALMMLLCFTLFAQAETTSSGSGINWMEVIFVLGYIGGIFVLLPIILYTNSHEKLFAPNSENQEEIKILENLNEDERNDRASIILEKIEENLTAFESDDDENMITITNGKQAKFMKQGLDYINKQLTPTNEEIIDRIEEFTNVYENRTERVFTGSKWIIVCSVALGGFVILTAGGFSSFLIFHSFGLLFYILSSRTTMYGIEKRLEYFGEKSNILGPILSGLMMGDGTKYYEKSGGSWSRDYGTENTIAIMGYIFMFIIAMIMGFLAAFLGVLNFILNYSTSYLLPIKPKEEWFAKNFPVT